MPASACVLEEIAAAVIDGREAAGPDWIKLPGKRVFARL